MYLFLFVLWLIFSGHITVEIIITGLVIVFLLGLLCSVLFSYTPAKDLRILKRLPLFFLYILVLVWEIIKANLNVITCILNSRKKLEPTLVTFDSGLKTSLGRFMLANSITLTPGTITIRVDGSRFTVHCLSTSMLDVSEDSTFLRLLRKMEA